MHPQLGHFPIAQNTHYIVTDIGLLSCLQDNISISYLDIIFKELS